MTITRNASCPFESSFCISQHSNIIVESGLIDSLEDLGLNWPPSSQFKLSHKLHCAPLATSNYTKEYEFRNVSYAAYQYGESLSPISDCNCTMAVNADSLAVASTDETAPFYTSLHEYSLFGTLARFSRGSSIPAGSLFSPIPGLGDHGGDLSIIFLLPNQILFSRPSQDDWYRATVPVSRVYQDMYDSTQSTASQLYGSDELAWPMGCVEKLQFCGSHNCTGFGSRTDTREDILEVLGISSEFLGPAFYTSFVHTLPGLVTILGKKSLASRYKTTNGLHTNAKANEWHEDIVHWAGTIYSAIQLRLVEMASGTGLGVPALENGTFQPVSSEWQQYCGSQVSNQPALIQVSRLIIHRKYTAQRTCRLACLGFSSFSLSAFLLFSSRVLWSSSLAMLKAGILPDRLHTQVLSGARTMHSICSVWLLRRQLTWCNGSWAVGVSRSRMPALLWLSFQLKMAFLWPCIPNWNSVLLKR
ncbi:hypothetical protein B0I35DRAFT_267343 [Stachybotrys elegans]|uniref:Uncharacterized protein n=1 Tax=Stachybotrys elegans TaxID=80388 RepID=A0A8K0WRZ0_9HYPO|nr:hypothetical protein B0I35DRAFT_267343 [Stachybotrys elegans]